MADFGLKYWAQMRSKHHAILWRVEIAERGYAGSSEEMTFAGDDPVVITWEARGDEFYVPSRLPKLPSTMQRFDRRCRSS